MEHVSNDTVKPVRHWCVATAESVTSDLIAGIDEVATGAIAGPIASAIVLLPNDHGIAELPVDSKALNDEDIVRLAQLIRERAVFSYVCYVDPQDVDAIGVKDATLMLWKKCANVFRSAYPNNPIHIDGAEKVYGLENHEAIVRGDGCVDSISAASIIASAYNLEVIHDISKKYPQYLFLRHFGYGHYDHFRVLEQYGPTEFHRKNSALRFVEKWKADQDEPLRNLGISMTMFMPDEIFNFLNEHREVFADNELELIERLNRVEDWSDLPENDLDKLKKLRTLAATYPYEEVKRMKERNAYYLRILDDSPEFADRWTLGLIQEMDKKIGSGSPLTMDDFRLLTVAHRLIYQNIKEANPELLAKQPSVPPRKELPMLYIDEPKNVIRHCKRVMVTHDITFDKFGNALMKSLEHNAGKNAKERGKYKGFSQWELYLLHYYYTQLMSRSNNEMRLKFVAAPAKEMDVQKQVEEKSATSGKKEQNQNQKSLPKGKRKKRQKSNPKQAKQKQPVRSPRGVIVDKKTDASKLIKQLNKIESKMSHIEVRYVQSIRKKNGTQTIGKKDVADLQKLLEHVMSREV